MTNKQTQHLTRVISAPKYLGCYNMGSAAVRHAADWSSPKPTILFGLGAVLGKETVRSKVDLEDEQEVMGKRRTKDKQAGQGRYGSQSGCGFVTPMGGVELQSSVGVRS